MRSRREISALMMFVSFKHEFGPQRRDRVAVNHPANHYDQAHQHHDARDENASEFAERSMCVGKKGGSGCVAGISHFLNCVTHSLHLNFKGIQLREPSGRRAQRGRRIGMHIPGRGHVFGVSTIQFAASLALQIAG